MTSPALRAAPSAAHPPLLLQLREHTALLHREVEAAVDLPRRVEDAEAYVDLLVRLYGFHVPFEAACRALASAAPRLEVQRRAKADAWIAARLKEATLYAETHSQPRIYKP